MPKETSTVRKKPRTETTESEGSLFEIVKSGKTALNVRALFEFLSFFNKCYLAVERAVHFLQ